eukprot:g4357.t1
MSALASDSNGNKSFSMESLAVPGVDPFFLSETKEKQDDVFRALFKENDSYKMKGTVEDIRKYWDVIREGYFSVLEAGACKSYHTLTHAIDVSVTCHSMLMSGAKLALHPEERSGMVLAAFAHDVLHPGMSNGFYVVTKAAVAVKYSNKAVLELQSIDFCLPLIKELGLFANEKSDTLKLVEECIAWTDMAQHKDLVAKIEALHPMFIESLNKAREQKNAEKREEGITKKDVENGINVYDFLTFEQRTIFASFLLHCADVSNLVKPWSTSQRWSVCVMYEFWAQGDVEKKLGLEISMNCDRNTVKIEKCQWGFASFVIKPLFQLFSKFMPELGAWYLGNLQNNIDKWKAIIDGKETFELVFNPPSKVGGWCEPKPRP